MEKKKLNYTVGYDIGIGSCGWAIVDDNNDLVDMGVVEFEEAGKAAVRRNKRSARRTNRRRKWRIQQLADAFSDFGIIDESEFRKQGYKSFSATHKNGQLDDGVEEISVSSPECSTIYDLRKKGLTQNLTPRELFLSLLNIVKTRGHFLLEDKVDFSKNGVGITAKLIAEKFNDIYLEIFDIELTNDKNDILEQNCTILFTKYEKDDLKTKIFDNEKMNNIFDFMMNFVSNFSCNTQMKKLEIFKDCEQKIIAEEFIKNDDKIDNFSDGQQKLIENLLVVYNALNVYKSLNRRDGITFEYISEYNVWCQQIFKDINNYVSSLTQSDIQEYMYENNLETEPESFEKMVMEKCNELDDDFFEKELRPRLRCSKKDQNVKQFYRLDNTGHVQSLPVAAIKNKIYNSFPNGLYVTEAKQILETNKNWLEPLLKSNGQSFSEFEDVIEYIIKAKIPSFMGPLTEDREHSETSWMFFNPDYKGPKKIKYSYDYMKDKGYFDEVRSISEWKKSMISHCTYLQDEYALPKEAFSIQLFSILNELNILVADEDHVTHLNEDQKLKVINEIYLNPNYEDQEIHTSDIQDLLNLSYFGTRKGKYNILNNRFTLYFKIIKIIESLTITDIKKEILDAVTSKESSLSCKIDVIDDIILNLNLLDDKNNKIEYFKKVRDQYSSVINHDLTDSEIYKLARLNTTDFSSISRKLIYNYNLTNYDQTLIEVLLKTNDEQQTIFTNANLSQNKYKKLLFANDNKLDINLLVDGKNKARLPISRSVLKSLNVCMKVHNEIIDLYGKPKKIVLETAKDFKDFSTQKEKCETRATNNKRLVDELIKQDKKFIKDNIDTKDLKEFIKKFEEDKSLQRKFELYIRQNGIDPISMEKIDLNHLVKCPHDFELGHIVPRICGDNSKDNIILITKTSNQNQNDRLPIQYHNSVSYKIQEYKKYVESLYKHNYISKGKYDRLLLEDQSDLYGFVNRNLNDTRYIISEFQAMLQAFHAEDKVKVSTVKGVQNKMYRRAFDFRKNREIGAQHHAHDAALSIVIEKINSERRKQVKQMQREEQKATRQKEDKKYIDDVTRELYKNVFGHYVVDKNSLISQIKDVVPLYNKLIDNMSTGKLFKDTLQEKINPYSIKKEYIKKIFKKVFGKKENTLEVDKQIDQIIEEIGLEDFINLYHLEKTGINSLPINYEVSKLKCCCFDIYKKNGKYYNIVVPTIIVKDGKIDPEKYNILVSSRQPKLIKNSDVDTSCFQFRIFKNSIVKKSSSDQILMMNGATNEDSRLIFKLWDIYSYSMITNKYEELVQNLKDRFNINNDKELFDYMVKEINNIDQFLYNLVDFYPLTIFNKKIENKSLIQKLEVVAYIKVVNELNNKANFIYYPSGKTDLLRKAINEFIYNNDDKIFKIKPNILGIRTKIENGEIKIKGPRNTINKKRAFKKIKKEKFTYNIKK